jgi:hypothetical protein
MPPAGVRLNQGTWSLPVTKSGAVVRVLASV